MTPFSCFSLLALCLLGACGPAKLPACPAIQTITVPTNCYQAGVGLTFTIEDRPAATPLTWYVLIHKDTTAKQPSLPGQYLMFKTLTNQLTLVDSVTTDYARIDLRAFDGQPCQEIQLHFIFIKRYATETNCLSWQLHSKFLDLN